MPPFDQLADRLSVPEGGFTIRPDGTEVTSGYAVSCRPDLEWVLCPPVRREDLEFYVRYARWADPRPETAVGGWHDPQTGTVYLDVSWVVDTADEAQALSRTFGQLAYYDFANGRSVPVTD